MERILRTRLFAAVVMAVVFGAGVLLGVAVSPTAPEAQAGRGRGDDARVPTYMQVTPPPTERQKAQIDSILRAHRAAYRALHEDVRKALDQVSKQYDPRRRALIMETRQAIKSVLTPEQAVQFDSLSAANDRRRAEGDRSHRSDRE